MRQCSWAIPPSLGIRKFGNRSGPQGVRSLRSLDFRGEMREGQLRDRRRTDVGIFPDRSSIIRLIGAVLAEQHDECAQGRDYLGLGVLAKSRLARIPNTGIHPGEEVMTPAALTSSSAH